jgi:hypothetical protein
VEWIDPGIRRMVIMVRMKLSQDDASSLIGRAMMGCEGERISRDRGGGREGEAEREYCDDGGDGNGEGDGDGEDKIDSNWRREWRREIKTTKAATA